MKEIKSFTVKRSKWLRGEGSSNSYLLRNDGKMCCLGFLGKACGAKPSELSMMEDPDTADEVNWPKSLLGLDQGNSITCNSLMSINDDEEKTGVKREFELKELFSMINIKIKFVD